MQRLALCVMAAVLLSTLAACQAPVPTRGPLPIAATAAQAPTRAAFATISVDDLRAMAPATRPRLIDVREPGEFVAGHVPGAVNVPLATVSAWSASQSPEAPLLVICRSGRRSAMASQTLVDKGFTRITNVDGGTAAWIQQGYPVETGARHH
jgi:rhodanese-related sulfurtransferase